jgi:N-acetylgalactosamine-N,N'-diacetylbacillosaminyl-diphospho-undecaprenol 4-alpha-N-acetylgalactosaminyltransferase
MKKKVFILINTLGTGGAERVVSLLIHSWKNQYNITLVLLTNLIEYDLPENISVISFNQPFQANGFLTTAKIPMLAWRYKNLCKKNKVDISISFLKRPNYISCLSVLLGNKAKIIISERSYFSELLKTFSPVQRRLSVFFTKKLYPHADLIITNSKLIKTDLEENFNINSRYKVIYNPMNVALIERLKKSKADLSGDSSFNFINVGAFRKEKNHKNLIEAFNKIRHLNVRLFLLGHRFLKDELILKVKKLQLESQIIFLDFDTNPFKYLSKCNCFVLSSDFEGFPNALLEAMVCGLPVISTDCLSGPREILAPDTDPVATVKDHIEITEYGILVPVKNSELLAEAMELIVKDKELHAKLRQKARERSLDFESGKIIEQYTDAIESL